jgi:asparagine synthase (glutamine-hydrolysing)
MNSLSRNIYRPPNKILGGNSGPLLSNRQYLTEAFQVCANEGGASLIIDGTYGEFSVTSRLPSGSLVRRMKAAVRRLISPPPAPEPDPTPYHVRVAQHLLSNPPDAIRQALDATGSPARRRPYSGLAGYFPGIEKPLALSLRELSRQNAHPGRA